MCWALPEVGKMHFCFIFEMFAFQNIHSSHFLVHFSHHFSVHSDHSSAKHLKMIQKWSRKWAENGPKMPTVNNPNDVPIWIALSSSEWWWRDTRAWRMFVCKLSRYSYCYFIALSAPHPIAHPHSITISHVMPQNGWQKYTWLTWTAEIGLPASIWRWSDEEYISR